MRNALYIEKSGTLPIKDFIDLFNTFEKLSDWFTPEELEKFDFIKKPESLACRYLVKKIIQEELALENRGNEIGILNNDLGAPDIFFSDEFQQIMKKRKINKIICSLSHSRLIAAAMVVFE